MRHGAIEHPPCQPLFFYIYYYCEKWKERTEKKKENKQSSYLATPTLPPSITVQGAQQSPPMSPPLTDDGGRKYDRPLVSIHDRRRWPEGGVASGICRGWRKKLKEKQQKEGKEKKKNRKGGIINQGEYIDFFFSSFPYLNLRVLPALALLSWHEREGKKGRQTVNGLCGLLPAGRVR